MEKEILSLQGENYEEADMGQLHAIHVNENAIAAIRSKLKTGPGLTECEECGDEIPEARRRAVAGVTHCIGCAEYAETMSNKQARLFVKNTDDQ